MTVTAVTAVITVTAVIVIVTKSQVEKWKKKRPWDSQTPGISDRLPTAYLYKTCGRPSTPDQTAYAIRPLEKNKP